MNGRAHALMGAITQAPVIALTGDIPTGIGLVLLATAAGLAPDLDHRGRTLPKKLLGPLGRPVSWLARAASSVAREATATGPDRSSWAWYQANRGIHPDHRALTHTTAAAIMAGVFTGVVALMLGWTPLAGLAVFMGWMSQVLSDGCTSMGVPLLWPLKVKGRRWYMVSFMRLRSGASSDWWVAWAWTGAFSALAVVLY
ncbi:metal-dependent hydrolase [Streptomyces sp. NPDC000927]|uniref:metal-dependent hydrolase n=1 Tax=Streptomyces sp. NPDC000927 TaxID=3154371 RepID=UPI00331BEF0D